MTELSKCCKEPVVRSDYGKTPDQKQFCGGVNGCGKWCEIDQPTEQPKKRTRKYCGDCRSYRCEHAEYCHFTNHALNHADMDTTKCKQTCKCPSFTAHELNEDCPTPTTESWEEEFDRKFVNEHDNIKNLGVLWLFKINDDGSRSIALANDVKSFIRKIRKEQPSLDITRDEIGEAVQYGHDTMKGWAVNNLLQFKEAQFVRCGDHAKTQNDPTCKSCIALLGYFNGLSDAINLIKKL